MHVSATRLPQMLKPADGFPSRRTDAGVEKYKRRVNQKTVFTNYNSGRYWQSVQNGSGDSWSVGLTNGNTTQSYISTPYYVRPIAAF